jgi:mono/diheme cytochrome c family protein
MCFRTWLLCAALGGAFMGCSKSAPDAAPPSAAAAPSAPAPAVAAAPVAAVDPKEVFTSRCATCHGASGHGDGPAAAALNPKPRNYTDGAWQKSVTDDQIRKTILYGGAAVGKSPVMPASPDLESKPEVLDGLIKLVRAFAPS